MLEELLKTMPDYTPALFMMAVIFCMEGKTGETKELFQLLRQKRVEIALLLNIIAKQLHAHGKKDEALLILNATIENKLNDQETMRLVDVLQNSKSAAVLQ
jgi:predicted Zn-dependent protease